LYQVKLLQSESLGLGVFTCFTFCIAFWVFLLGFGFEVLLNKKTEGLASVCVVFKDELF
jgi:hypothetical protein